MIEATSKPPRRNERRRARDQKRHPGRAEMRKAHHPGKMAGLKANMKEQSTEANSKAKPMIARVVLCHNGDAVPYKALQTGLATRTTEGAASRAPHHCDSGFFYVHVLRMATRNAQIQPAAKCVWGKVWQSVWGIRKGAPVPSAGSLTRTDCQPYLAMRLADSLSVPKEPFMADVSAISVRTAPAHHGNPFPTYRDTPAHTGDFNRDVIAVGNAENAIARVLAELRKPRPDNARALKLAQSAMLAIGLVGEVLQ